MATGISSPYDTNGRSDFIYLSIRSPHSIGNIILEKFLSRTASEVVNIHDYAATDEIFFNMTFPLQGSKYILVNFSVSTRP